MSIEVTVGGALTAFIPPGNSGNSFHFENTESLTVATLLATLGISEDQRMMVILNGNVVDRQQMSTALLNDDDTLALMPPIAAG